MSKNIYISLQDEDLPTPFLKEALPVIKKSLGVQASHQPVRTTSFAEALQSAHDLAAQSSNESLFVIITDATGDKEEIVRLVASVPTHAGISVIAANVVGAKNMSWLQDHASPRITFTVMAYDAETESVLKQMIIDRMRGGKS